MANCRRAGVKIMMITGDHPVTAQVLARELGIFRPGDRLLTGVELDRLSEAELGEIIGNVSVCARTSPQQKLRIVTALKRQGFIVAMTGDGVNDAPAIKAADIGLAMGKNGTEVSKEASALILTDDNFATIVSAMEEGRNIYANIRKSVRYLLATNVGEVVVMFLAILLGLPLPLLPAQLLWMNLIGDGLPALALAADPATDKLLHQPPRPKEESLFAHSLGKKISTRGLLIGIGALGVYAWGLTTGNLALARTMVLATLVVSQLIHVFDCRKEETEGRTGTNKFLFLAVGSSALLLAGGIYCRWLRGLFTFHPLNLRNWLLVFGVNSMIAVLDKGMSLLYAIKEPKTGFVRA